jgi:hypothetical protein
MDESEETRKVEEPRKAEWIGTIRAFYHQPWAWFVTAALSIVSVIVTSYFTLPLGLVAIFALLAGAATDYILKTRHIGDKDSQVVTAIIIAALVFLNGYGWWIHYPLTVATQSATQGISVSTSGPSPTPFPTMEIINGGVYSLDRVPLDYKIYKNCDFENVTFMWNGGPGSLTDSRIKMPFNITSDNPTINNTVLILKNLGWLKDGIKILDNHGKPAN